MSSSARTMEILMDDLAGVGDVRYRKMFGEYALYYEEKVVAFVCDDQLFIKPTDAGRAYIGSPDEAPPYPGAKNYFRISEERWDDRDWLRGLVRTTADALPATSPRKRR